MIPTLENYKAWWEAQVEETDKLKVREEKVLQLLNEALVHEALGEDKWMLEKIQKARAILVGEEEPRDGDDYGPVDPHGRPLYAQEGLPYQLCWQGPTYSHPPHVWEEDRPGGNTYYCPGASTDRT